ncbi:4'-phosphopantetheinyl transferase superfamily protein [Flavobacterium sp. NKUCC04_CG]|uniref:4'-phosphopantetheinyl transferase family protein n=1 Tax=Flavobacterium sp. NKUCC04_CG TaxID=2842121 RepID=UPI001C5BD85D|nr:4'-phosphopantetheinyl transferase superfamily protein [Flavobacterium sp. NKUCC04_CG]MBW3518616.1 4'-phosphopantetheinyl transferase superfamily protein [Flavobacterium sp. NKUCC04_CG]
MIGNDVIDLQLSRCQSNWQRKGFIQKLFVEEEQLYIAHSSDPELAVWLLWSMKEAAYKIYNRQTKIRAYIPKKLICNLVIHNKTMALGQVFCEGVYYYTQSYLSPDCVHTIATALLSDLNQVVEIDKTEVIKDHNGIPNLINEAKNSLQPVSISHHGRFEKVVVISSPKPNYFPL